jgi:signal transduction histidine kinase
MINYILWFLIIIVNVLNLWIGFFVGTKNLKNKTNFYFLLLTLIISGWIISNFISNIVQTKEEAIFWAKLTYGFAAYLIYIFVLFTYNFPKEKLQKIPKLEILYVIPFLILEIFIFFDEIIGNEVRFTPLTIYVSFGKNFYLFPLFFLFYLFSGIFILIRKLIRSKGQEKTQISYLFYFALIAFIVGVVLNLLIPWLGGIERGYTTNFGPLGIIIMVFGIAYAITKHHLFGIRVILTEALVIATGLTLLIWAVMAEPFTLKILGGALFVFFTIFGYQLVRSVIKEIELRAELEKAYAELERIDRAKTEFLSMASHQLRTPLGIIRGYISMMLEGDYGEFPKEAKMRLENTLISSERLVKLVNDLLDITRLEMGRIELNLEKASIEEIISGVVEEMKEAAEKKGLYLKWAKPATALPEMSLDKNKIRQVILNLVDNGIKYTEKGGVTVKVRRMNSEVRIEISDTGVGMEKGEIEKLFEIMARGRAGLQYWMQGAGLGLYTARKFAEMHGGRVWAESPGKDKGSTFYIELPIK